MSKETNKATFSPQVREEMKAQIQTQKAELDALKKDLEPGRMGPMTTERSQINQELAARRISRQEQVLADGTPEKAPSSQVPELESRREKLKREISDMMLTEDEMTYTAKDRYKFQAASRKSKAQEVGNPRFAEMCKEFREISRSLQPDDPEYASTERLRKPS